MTAMGPSREQGYAMLKALRFCFGDAEFMDAEMVIEALEKYGFDMKPNDKKPND